MMKRFLMFLVFLAMAAGLMTAAASAAPVTASGECGDNTHWTLDAEGTLTVSGTGAVCDYDRGSAVPWYGLPVRKIVVQSGVTRIGSFAFSYQHSLTEVSLPDGLTEIGDYAFYQLSGLNSPETIALPATVTKIGAFAFAWSQLESITLPSGLTELGERAFYHAALISAALPAGLTQMGEAAFRDCAALESISIPEGVTTIPAETFSGCRALREAAFPSTLASIGDRAFSGCGGITAITFPQSITAIGERAFSGAGFLTAEFLGDVPEFGTTPFEGCTAILFHPHGNSGWFEVAPLRMNNLAGSEVRLSDHECGENLRFDIALEGDEIVLTFRPINPNRPGRMPESSDNEAWHAVRNKVTEIRLDGVSYVGSYAFSFCSRLTEITLPESVRRIGSGAFTSCENLTSVCILGTDVEIDDYAFMNDARLTSFSIAGSVKTLGQQTFCRADSLGELYFPDGLETIGRYCFWKCGSLRSIALPDGITEIPESAFSDCTNLRSVRIPETVQKIGSTAFENCRRLTELFIPEGVKELCIGAFDSCTGLTTVVFEGAGPYESKQGTYFRGVQADAYYNSSRASWHTLRTVLEGDSDLRWFAYSDREISLWVDGIPVMNYPADIFGDGTVRYTPAFDTETPTLTLNNADFGSANNRNAAIYTTDQLIISLSGSENTLTGAGYGIYSEGFLTIRGGGLTVNGSSIPGSCGICAELLDIDGSRVTVSDDPEGSFTYGISVTGSTPAVILRNGGALCAYGTDEAACFPAAIPGIILPEGCAALGGTAAWSCDPLTVQSCGESYCFAGGENQAANYLHLDPSVEYYPVYIGGRQLNSINCADVYGDHSVRYSPADGADCAVLTLTDVQGSIPAPKTGADPWNWASVYAAEDLRIELVGSNTITGPNHAYTAYSYGILADAVLTIGGSGSLTAAGGNILKTSIMNDSCGISATALCLTDHARVTAAGGNCSNKSARLSIGVDCRESLAISGGAMLEVCGGSGSFRAVYGLRCGNGIIIHDERVLAVDLSGENPALLTKGEWKTARMTHLLLAAADEVSCSGGTIVWSLPDMGADIPVTVVAAQYVGGWMTAVRAAAVNLHGGAAAQRFDFTATDGAEYRLFLTEESGFAPLCMAWGST